MGSGTLLQQEKKVLKSIVNEYQEALKTYGPFASPHEGYAIIKEELDELWYEIKHGQSKLAMEIEATQIAAMAMRFVIDCTK